MLLIRRPRLLLRLELGLELLAGSKEVSRPIYKLNRTHDQGTFIISIAMDADLIIEISGLIAPFDAYSVKEAGENICLCSGFSSEARHVDQCLMSLKALMRWYSQ